MKTALSITLPLLGLLAASCSDSRVKMPWEDDLNAKHQQELEAGQMPEAKLGEPLPLWNDGCLDIHLINTGRGECLFHILPDGTTLLIDAGEMTADNTSVEQKPSAEMRPYIADATYIKHFLPKGKTAIDYFSPSHFHGDHIGTPAFATSTAPGGYLLSGATALFDLVPYANIIDRGYPSYADDATIPPLDGGLAQDYIKFVKYVVANKGVHAERFEVGKEQFKLLNDREKYPNFSIFNVCANGSAWDADPTTGQITVVKGSNTGGNPASCGIHLKYGRFDYLTCGDVTSTPQNLVANYCARNIPKGGMDVFKCHHHLSSNSWGSGMQVTEFSPRVIVNQNFYQKQPDADLLASIATGVFASNTYKWDKDFFTTNLHPTDVTECVKTELLAGYGGHIVVRVAPGGDKYYVYMLTDTDFSFKVTAIHGPYTSK